MNKANHKAALGWAEWMKTQVNYRKDSANLAAAYLELRELAEETLRRDISIDKWVEANNALRHRLKGTTWQRAEIRAESAESRLAAVFEGTKERCARVAERENFPTLARLIRALEPAAAQVADSKSITSTHQSTASDARLPKDSLAPAVAITIICGVVHNGLLCNFVLGHAGDHSWAAVAPDEQQSLPIVNEHLLRDLKANYEHDEEALRLKGMEEAAKICDVECNEPECPERAQYCAEAIRAEIARRKAK